MSKLGWASGDGCKGAERGLRRGAWYPVLETADRFVVLDVNDVEVRFTHERLRFRSGRPNAWTVVQLTPAEAEAEARAHGHPDVETLRSYLVCPGCHARQHLGDLWRETRCEECGNTYPVDWVHTAGDPPPRAFALPGSGARDNVAAPHPESRTWIGSWRSQ
jgi:hypothetical protein